MASNAERPTQKTAKGVEIPVPTRDEFFRDLRKVAPPDKPEQEQDEPANEADEADERD